MALSLRPLTVFPITTRTLEVLRVADVTPGMRRITIGGDELAAHVAANGYPVAAFRSDGFDDEFKLILRHPDAAETVGPTQADGVLNWPRGDEHLLFRTYTVRRWDPVAGEVDVDIAKHGIGPAAAWAYRVQPGERVQVAGPKSSSPHPVDADWTLIAGDETALPAIGRWLEQWPDGARAQVFVEIAEEAHRQDLPVPEGVELTWLSRDGAAAGTTTLLFDALRAAPWWDGTVFAWVAGETLTLTPIRRWLRGEKGLGKEQVEVTGYWRKQEVVASEADAGVQDLDATEDEEERFHELSELLPAFALRVAASIGLGVAFDGADRTLDQLVARTGADRAGLDRLLRYLGALGVVEDAGNGAGDGAFRLTGLGRELEDEYVVGGLDLGGLHGQRELAGALALHAAVRTGRGDHARWFDGEWPERASRAGDLLSSRVEHDAEEAGYSASALAEVEPFGDVATVALMGRGTGAFAEALTQRHPHLRATIVAPPSELEALQRLHGPLDRVELVPGSPLSAPERRVEAVLLTGLLDGLPDADAVHVLRQAAAGTTPGGAVLVFGRVLEPDLADEHEYEHDLIEFALTGGGLRDDAQHRALFAAAGLGDPDRRTVGWGDTLYRVTAPLGL